MNFLYTNYQENNFDHTTKAQWKKYGITSFKNLWHFLGYPRNRSLHYMDNCLHYETIPAGKTILEQGAISDKMYFIIKGKVKIGKLHEGNFQPFLLLNDGNIATSLYPFLYGIPSLNSTETISPTKVLWINKSDYTKVVEKMDQGGFAKVFETFSVQNSKHWLWVHSNVFLNASEKVKLLRDTYPEIFSLFSDSQIAMLLGVTRETFSRAKKELFKNADPAE